VPVAISVEALVMLPVASRTWPTSVRSDCCMAAIEATSCPISSRWAATMSCDRSPWAMRAARSRARSTEPAMLRTVKTVSGTITSSATTTAPTSSCDSRPVLASSSAFEASISWRSAATSALMSRSAASTCSFRRSA